MIQPQALSHVEVAHAITFFHPHFPAMLIAAEKAEAPV